MLPAANVTQRKNRRVVAAVQQEDSESMQRLTSFVLNLKLTKEQEVEARALLQLVTSELRAALLRPSAEEIERSRSLVLIGLPEPNSLVASERQSQDEASITAWLNKLNIAARPTAVYRLGHQNSKRSTMARTPSRSRKGHRLVKVVLPSSEIKLSILDAMKSKRDEIRKAGYPFENILVRTSMSLEERRKEKELREELAGKGKKAG